MQWIILGLCVAGLCFYVVTSLVWQGVQEERRKNMECINIERLFFEVKQKDGEK